MDPESTRTDSPVEARIARIESDVAHLSTDVSDIKVDLRALRDKVDGVESLMHEKFDSLKDGNAGLQSEIASAKNWGLALSMTLTGVILTVMARGFGWI
jgi:hypothetical protein